MDGTDTPATGCADRQYLEDHANITRAVAIRSSNRLGGEQNRQREPL